MPAAVCSFDNCFVFVSLFQKSNKSRRTFQSIFDCPIRMNPGRMQNTKNNAQVVTDGISSQQVATHAECFLMLHMPQPCLTAETDNRR